MITDYLRWLAACFAALAAGIVALLWLAGRWFGDEPRNAQDAKRAFDERRKGKE